MSTGAPDSPPSRARTTKADIGSGALPCISRRGVVAHLFFAGLRQIQLAGAGNFIPLECFINRETENEWVTFGEALAHLPQTDDAMIRGNLMIGRLLVARSWRLVCELRKFVRPFLFTAYAKLDERFDAVADHRARIVIDRPFHRAFIVVNEQPAQIGDRVTRFSFEEFQVAN